MKSKVYFTAVKDSVGPATVKSRLRGMLKESRFADFILQDDLALKAHFGEGGNTGYVRPDYMRVICDEVATRCPRVLSDTNTLYRGRRLNSAGHLELARGTWLFKRAYGC